MGAAFLRSAREAAGLTQDEVAERARVERTMIVRLEKDARSLKVERVNDLASALNMSPDALLRGLGVNLAPRQQDLLDRALVTDLLEAPRYVLDAVRLLLDGWRTEQSRHKPTEASEDPSRPGRPASVHSRRGGRKQP